MGPQSILRGQKHGMKPEHNLSHPSYTSNVCRRRVVWGPRKEKCFYPGGERTLDRRKGSREAFIERVSICRLIEFFKDIYSISFEREIRPDFNIFFLYHREH